MRLETILKINIPCFFNNNMKNFYHPSGVAQLVERVTVNHQVGGSSPSSGAQAINKRNKLIKEGE